MTTDLIPNLAQSGGSIRPWLFIIIPIGCILILLYIVARQFRPYLRARNAGFPIPLLTLFRFSLHKADTQAIVSAYIEANRAGLYVEVKQLEVHSLCNGDLAAVVEALVYAKEMGVDFGWDLACALDLAGRDVVAAVRMLKPGGSVKDLDLGEIPMQSGAQWAGSEQP
ncbi:MAG: flotillin-like FloA family protein [Planctomycetota bacterium]